MVYNNLIKIFFYRTVCGTPNYIAPEVLTKIGHSYEADVWSIGCIMYTLLVGKPPFETSTLKETYARIKQVQYETPQYISKPAMNMVSNMLQLSPSKRPSVAKLMKDYFFSSGKANQHFTNKKKYRSVLDIHFLCKEII